MSVWSDMGVMEGEMRGVNPCTFLNTAYGFFKNLRYQIWPGFDTMNLADWDFNRHRKASDIGIHGIGRVYWPSLGRDLSFPHGEDYGYSRLFRPVTEEYWNTSPDFDAIFNQTEETLLEEAILQNPYGTGARPAIMDPAWPVQRYKVIQQLRYITVPLDIRVEVQNWGTSEWYRAEWYSEAGYNQYGCIDKTVDRGFADYFDWIFLRKIEAKFADYWTQGNTVCKIGVFGEKPYDGYSIQIDGCFWVNDKEYSCTRSSGVENPEQKLRIYGAVDLSTHPDFAQYFDITENEEE